MLGGALFIKIVDSRAEHVVPIVINQATGDAIAVDYRVVDAAGEERSPFEVRRFCEDFLAEAYTYNRYTVKTKLESIARWTAPYLSKLKNSRLHYSMGPLAPLRSGTLVGANGSESQ
jgi:hypothetical protein